MSRSSGPRVSEGVHYQRRRLALVAGLLAALLAAPSASCGGGLEPIVEKPDSGPPLNCDEHDVCGIDPKTLKTIDCTGFGEVCIALTKCQDARCVQYVHACQWECGGECSGVGMSFPPQLLCKQ